MPESFAPLPTFTGRPRPKRKHAVFPTGPRLFKMGTRPARLGVGPGEPPEGFLTAHNSRDEWWVYWAFARVEGTPRNPRVPPFLGGDTWQYQVPESPTTLGLGRGRVVGGSVSDFVIVGPTERVTVVRLQTERFHISTDPTTQARDLFIRDHLRGVERLIDIYSQDFIGDPSGEAVCRVVALAMKGIELPSPIRYRSALKVRAVR